MEHEKLDTSILFSFDKVIETKKKNDELFIQEFHSLRHELKYNIKSLDYCCCHYFLYYFRLFHEHHDNLFEENRHFKQKLSLKTKTTDYDHVQQKG
jgi:hypothetical protein